MMGGTDRLNGGTGTTSVSQRSESGQGILDVKEGRGMWVWSTVVLSVLSSCMPAGGCSLTERHDNVSCLTITTISPTPSGICLFIMNQ
jgi:hypothetical protein